ncbi:MAG: uroporphyrinogen-III synthase [Halothiobacillaceae bacterium]
MATLSDPATLPPLPSRGEGPGERDALAARSLTPLLGLRVAITRPAGQSVHVVDRIRAAGGEAIALPLLEITPPTIPVHPDELKQQLEAAEVVIFISPNAVRMAQRILSASDWPRGARLACVGHGTARALREAGFHDLLVPAEGADSEALLALTEMHEVRDRHILIVRGEGGRTLLANTLTQRGAHVDHAVVYCRRPLPPDLVALRAWGEMIFVITSTEALRVLVAAAHTQTTVDWLREQVFVFGHPRIAETGRTLGLLHGIIVGSPADDAIFAALVGLAHTQDGAESFSASYPGQGDPVANKGLRPGLAQVTAHSWRGETS